LFRPSADLSFAARFGYYPRMTERIDLARELSVAVTPSSRTLHAEMLRLCARIGYSPPAAR
jgi:hypothetical protein